MNIPELKLLTRKDVARILGVTIWQVRNNEERWGLLKGRIDLNGHCVRYLEATVKEVAKSFVQ